LRNWGPPTGIDSDNVVFKLRCGTLSAISNLRHRSVSEKVFGGTETNSKFVVVPRCSHRCGNQISIEPNLEWFLNDDLIRKPRDFATADTLHKIFFAPAASHDDRVLPTWEFMAKVGGRDSWLFLFAFKGRGKVMLQRLTHCGHRSVVRQRVTLDSQQAMYSFH
jgi:hypothetical protein